MEVECGDHIVTGVGPRLLQSSSRNQVQTGETDSNTRATHFSNTAVRCKMMHDRLHFETS